MALVAIGVAGQAAVGGMAGSPLMFLFFPPVSYLLAVVLIAGSTWLIAPPVARGWWVVRYAASVLLAGVLAVLATTIFPAIDPSLHALRGEPRWIWDMLLLAVFGVVVWLFWRMLARPHLVKTPTA